jgi:hypothetical protein
MQKNFKFGLFSAVHLLFTLTLLAAGSIILLSSISLNLNRIAVNALLNHPSFFLNLGSFLVAMSLILLYGFYDSYKGRYLKLEVGSDPIFIHEKIMEEYLASYWMQNFPEENKRPLAFLNQKQKLEIILTYPKTTLSNSELSKKLEGEIRKVLSEKLGYKKSFILTMMDS